MSEVYSVGGAKEDITDKRPFQGPAVATLDALQSPGLEAVKYVLVLPVDMPAMRPAILQHLLDYTKSNHCGCYHRGYMMPAILKVSEGFIASSEEHLERHTSLSMSDLVRINRAAELSEIEQLASSGLNINFPGQWQSFLRSQAEGE